MSCCFRLILLFTFNVFVSKTHQFLLSNGPDRESLNERHPTNTSKREKNHGCKPASRPDPFIALGLENPMAHHSQLPLPVEPEPPQEKKGFRVSLPPNAHAGFLTLGQMGPFKMENVGDRFPEGQAAVIWPAFLLWNLSLQKEKGLQGLPTNVRFRRFGGRVTCGVASHISPDGSCPSASSWSACPGIP